MKINFYYITSHLSGSEYFLVKQKFKQLSMTQETKWSNEINTSFSKKGTRKNYKEMTYKNVNGLSNEVVQHISELKT